MDRAFLINAPSVISEIIDGEVIIMNLKSGNYYSSDKVGAVVWSWIQEGRSAAEISNLARRRYRAEPEQIERELHEFFEALITEGLLRENQSSHNGHSSLAEDSDSAKAQELFSKPELCCYSDLQDLLYLDPIHDVDAIGWPKSKNETQ